MSTPREPAPGKLVLSVLAAGDWWLLAWPGYRAGLVERFGPLDYESPALAFDHTDYYDAELGARQQDGPGGQGGLFRRILGFARLVPLDSLADVKLAFNADEREHARPAGTRRVNLDPGLITLERFVLASGKNFTHRVYLRQGIWADLTLVYNKKSGWVVLPWTFPDYATEDMKRRLTHLRALYKTTTETADPSAPEGAPECP